MSAGEAGGSDASGSPMPAGELDPRRREYLLRIKMIRAMPTSQFVATQTAEALAAGVAFSLVFSPVFLVNSMFAAKFPSAQAAGHKPIPLTFGGLFAAGLRGAVATSFKTCMWFGGTAGMAAVLKESLKLGVRHHDAEDVRGMQMAAAAQFVSGWAAAFVVLRNSMPSAPRRALYSGMLGGSAGVLLPATLAASGPYVRRIFQKVLADMGPPAGGEMR